MSNGPNMRIRVWNIPSKLEEKDVEGYFTDRYGKAKVVQFVSQKEQPSTAIVDLQQDEKHMDLKRSHELNGQKITVLPEVFDKVTAVVSKNWIRMLRENGVHDCNDFLKDNCVTGVEVKSSADGRGYWLVGHLDDLEKTKIKLLESESVLFSCNHDSNTDAVEDRGGSVSEFNSKETEANKPADQQAALSRQLSKDRQQDDGEGSSSSSSQPLRARERKLKKTDGENASSGTEAVSTSQQKPVDESRDDKLSAMSNDVMDREAAPKETNQSNQDSNQRQPRRLRHPVEPAADKACVKPELVKGDVHAASGYDDKNTVCIPLSKERHYYIMEACHDEFSQIITRTGCNSFSAIDTGDDFRWIFSAESLAQLTETERKLKRLRQSVHRIDDRVRLPAKLEKEQAQVIAAGNQLKTVTLKFDFEQRICLITGFDKEQVDGTKRWLKETLEDNYPNPEEPRTGRSAVNDNVDQRNPGKNKNTSNLAGQPVDPDFVATVRTVDDAFVFNTNSGLEVRVYKGDMLQQRTDVIVNSANDQLAHGGGLARAILEAGGPEIDKESRDIIKARGSLRMGDVVHTTAGRLSPPIHYVVHAVPPSGHQMQTRGREECTKALVQTFYGSLVYANDTLAVRSISIPPFGAGIFAVPVGDIVKAAYQALADFDCHVRRLDRGSASGASPHQVTLREIHFISNDANITEEIISSFKHMIGRSCSAGTGTLL